jgi:predicted HD phosphohydrolase
MPPLLEQIEAMFEVHGAQPQDMHAGEPVTALSHALQCAQLAEWADAPAPLVCAALLHDVGHFVPATAPSGAAERLPHEQRALNVLADGFDEAVLGPIRLHVQAKRYLVATDARYAERLSSRSRRALTAQGGPMSREQQRRFEQQPHAWGAVQLRRWDDRAKEPGKRTPPLAYYLGVLDEMLQTRDHRAKIAIGARGI